MRHFVRKAVFGFVVAGSVGCTGAVGGPGTGAGNGAGTGTGTGAGGSSSGGAITCVPGIPATTQLRRMLNRQYDATVRDLLGVTSLGAGANAGPPSSLLYADFGGPMVPDAWRIYQDVGAAIAKAVMADSTLKANFINCDPAASGCLTQTIQTFGRKAFRRPLTADEVTRFQALGLGTPTGTPAEVAEATLLAFLVSPSFLMLPETNTTPDRSGQGLQLSSYEVATRLSYMLWGSTPDDTLGAAADNNQLQTKDQILAQAQRMIAVRPKTAPLVSSFHDHWVQMDNSGQHWWKIDHDTTKFPLYSAVAKTASQSELDSFWGEVAYTNGGFKDLFLSNIGFVNKDDAAIYGLDPSQYGASLTKVQLDPSQRPGFMTRVGFLSSYSHFTETAPILRGAFITVYMIGVNPGPPIAGATALQAPPGNYATNREKTTALVNMSPTCMGCHSGIINPPGFVLENFDAVGKWQTVDQLGGPIDPTGNVNFGDGNIQPITSVLQLMQQIAQVPAVQHTYAQYWVAYAYGRDPNPNDQCVADQLGVKLPQDGYGILNVLADLTQADSFRVRVRATP
jgi:Protein of unknown function (DUF1592)/Protein of unknown function (DUF1588)/Protein of unknown function (DUF1595)/Protein of unknown function (DUF1585)